MNPHVLETVTLPFAKCLAQSLVQDVGNLLAAEEWIKGEIVPGVVQAHQHEHLMLLFQFVLLLASVSIFEYHVCNFSAVCTIFFTDKMQSQLLFNKASYNVIFP